MKKTGRAAVYVAPNAPFVMRHYALREVTDGEALVRITMATICRSDLHSYHGLRPNPCPGILGHEIIGVIEQLGRSVTHDLRGTALACGDRVTWTMFFHAGKSYYRDVHDMPQKAEGVRKYGHEHAEQDPHFLGGFANYCYIQPGTGILKLPEGITDAEATPLNCGIATMVSVIEAAQISKGDTVVFQGLGLLGLYGCAIAKFRGAKRVIGLDTVPHRLAMAGKFGADHTVDISGMSGERQIELVRERCLPDGADAVIEVCGVAAAVPLGLKMLRVGGRYTIAGLVSPNANMTLDGHEILRRWITLRGIHNYHPRHLVLALDFVMASRDRFPFADIVDAKFPLERLDEAFQRASENAILRAAIVP